MEALLGFIIAVIIVIIIASVALWAVQHFLPEAYPPARYLIGGLALIYILIQLLKLVESGIPGL